MMKYTACSMLAVGAVAVMQGESMAQTDALQIKVDRNSRGYRMVAKEHGGILPASLTGVSKPKHNSVKVSRGSHTVFASPKRQTKVASGPGETENESPNASGPAPNAPPHLHAVARRGGSSERVVMASASLLESLGLSSQVSSADPSTPSIMERPTSVDGPVRESRHAPRVTFSANFDPMASGMTPTQLRALNQQAGLDLSSIEESAQDYDA